MVVLLAYTTVVFVQQCAANRGIAPCIIKDDAVALWCAPSQCHHGLAFFLLGPASCTISTLTDCLHCNLICPESMSPGVI
jgi:hypothetical protein